MTLTIEKLDHLIDLLEVDEEHISLKEIVYLKAMRIAREQLLKKPVAYARRVKPLYGFSDTWSVDATLEKDPPVPSNLQYHEFKPLYDK